MKYLPFLLVLLSLSFNAHSANDVDNKKFTVGLGMYSTPVKYDGPASDDTFSGAGFSFGYAFSDQLALRATYFSLENTDNSNAESDGYDLLAYFGTRLMSRGFKAYIGGGFFVTNGPLKALLRQSVKHLVVFS